MREPRARPRSLPTHICAARRFDARPDSAYIDGSWDEPAADPAVIDVVRRGSGQSSSVAGAGSVMMVVTPLALNSSTMLGSAALSVTRVHPSRRGVQEWKGL